MALAACDPCADTVPLAENRLRYYDTLSSKSSHYGESSLGTVFANGKRSLSAPEAAAPESQVQPYSVLATLRRAS